MIPTVVLSMKGETSNSGNSNSSSILIEGTPMEAIGTHFLEMTVIHSISSKTSPPAT